MVLKCTAVVNLQRIMIIASDRTIPASDRYHDTDTSPLT
jgi:hypothetical protein